LIEPHDRGQLSVPELDVSVEERRVMPIVFTSPLFGVLMATLHGGEPLTLKTLMGMALTIGGIVILTIG
jgi:uncharacterized membrane protein